MFCILFFKAFSPKPNDTIYPERRKTFLGERAMIYIQNIGFFFFLSWAIPSFIYLLLLKYSRFKGFFSFLSQLKIFSWLKKQQQQIEDNIVRPVGQTALWSIQVAMHFFKELNSCKNWMQLKKKFPFILKACRSCRNLDLENKIPPWRTCFLSLVFKM